MERESAALLYDQTAHVIGVFWEWRHKLLTLGTTAISLLIGSAGLLRGTGASALSLVAGAAGGVVGIALILLDRRNQQILDVAYERATDLEKFIGGDGIFTKF